MGIDSHITVTSHADAAVVQSTANIFSYTCIHLDLEAPRRSLSIIRVQS